MTSSSITSVSSESRVFHPSQEFRRTSHIKSREEYRILYEASIRDPAGFWAEQARRLTWFKRPSNVIEWNPPYAKWFSDGTLNVAYNCLDRHLDGDDANKLALIWEGESGDRRTFTYTELHAEVCKAANALTSLGVRAGDRVAVYMGMVPEAMIAMLACARVGAVHTVIFGGFASDAIRDRVNDAQAKVVITQDAAWRRGKPIPLKAVVDEALHACPEVEHVIVVNRANMIVHMEAGRDTWWNEVVDNQLPEHTCVEVNAEHPLFILYTSGTTGKPKGVLHTTGGYLLSVNLSTQYVFDLQPGDVFWCTADVGWVTGHNYVIYGPLSNGATTMMYEGTPDFPDKSRIWEIIARYKVTVFYTAPTAIRAFMKWGEALPNLHDLSSLRLLGSVGEPINPEAWMWYHTHIGNERCPIVDTWWQTETGSIMLTPLPGAVSTKPGSCCLPFFGVSAQVLREDGTEASVNEGGLLVIDRPWPSMLRTVWRDDERYRSTYFSKFDGKYLTGDGARRDEDGYFWVMGRVDDVVNVAGHRLGTAEVESALVSHPAVAEAAVVGRPDDLKGQALIAFVTVRANVETSRALGEELAAHVAKEIGKFAAPSEVRFASSLPKTRSGKIMRRLLKQLAAGEEPTGDLTTLEDPSVIEQLRSRS